MNIEKKGGDTFHAFRADAHYQHLLNVIPPWLRQATPLRREALSKIKPGLPAALRNAPKPQHKELGNLIARQVTSQNQVDQALANLRSPHVFAEPLLKSAIKERFNLDVDVRAISLHLYIPTHIPWLRLKSGGARTWTVSLLDAALHNFESVETEDDAFEPDSTYITSSSSSGQFQTLPQVLHAMPIAGFTRLCRELDIGERYKAYLEENLGFSNPEVAAVLQHKIQESQKAALTTALHMALMQKLLDADVHSVITGLLDGLRYLRLRRQEWHCHELTIMNARLTGIVLFAPDLETAQETVKVVAYIPDDPEHPVKQYPSSVAFAEDLRRRLRDPSYQQFFSRFIDHEERGHFFAQINNLLSPITWQPVQPGDPRPTWREEPAQRVDLHIAGMLIKGDPWTHLYQRKLDKILNDARVIAVSTSTVDRRARWALWDSFTEIASTLLNIAAFIALPFVPFLGELMLGYMAYQLLDETFEGVIDWAEGMTKEAFNHFMGVVESALQIGGFAAGGAIAASTFRSVLPKEVVQFIDRFNAVKRPDGNTRYWQPDLAHYEYPAAPPKGARLDALGLFEHQGKTLLALENKHYAISKDQKTGLYRIDHPSRPEAYKPELKHNGAGAWQTELDQPLIWDQATLLRRAGPDMQRFSSAERERMLNISGTHENALRKIHVDARQLPPLLADTVKRFNIDRDIQTFIEKIRSDRPEDYLDADPATQLVLLCDNGYWPAGKGLRLIDANGRTIWERRLPDQPVVQIDQTRLHSGDLLKTMLLTLGESETRTLMSEEFGAPAPSIEARSRTLRQLLADIAMRKRQALFDNRYRTSERKVSRLAQNLIDAEHGLPTCLAEALLQTASEQELQLLEHGTLSEHMQQLTRQAGLQARISRTYEGLDLASCTNNPDTERLALHTLERLPGWSGQLRLEIREYIHEGRLLDSIGDTDAPHRKVLVLNPDGSYQAFDDSGLELGAADTFYLDILQALPDSERIALDIHIGEGEKLRQRITTYALNRDEVGELLSQHPNLKPTYDPTVMRLLGGTDGYHRQPFRGPTLQAYVHELLPQLSAEQVQSFVVRLQQHPDGPRAELSRLRAEHARLDGDLQRWRNEVPRLIPGTATRLSEEQIAIQQQIRRHFADELLNAWRQHVVQAGVEHPFVELRLTQAVFGELPVLNVDLSRVTSLSIEGHSFTRGAHEFLNSFSGLRRLALRNLQLNHVPEVVARSPHLNELILSDCAITLSTETHATLAALTRLTTLDLYKNPLGRVPDVQNMPMLNYIDATHTGIDSLPSGLLSRPQLRTALLNDNRISELPDALFDLPAHTREGFDLGANPLTNATRERIKSHFRLTDQDLGVFAEQMDIDRVQALYPQLDQEEASNFVYRLPGTLVQGRVEITRLENELLQLSNDLSAWTADVPAIHPLTGEPFSAQELQSEHLIRDHFKTTVERCWRRQSELDGVNEDLQPTYELHLPLTITGDLPVLHANFSHVSALYLDSNARLTSGAGGFLESFLHLKELYIRNYNLGDIPGAMFRMGHLKIISLSDCQITLTQQSALALAQMENLVYLDLNSNPLGRTPDVSQMPHLQTLLLDDTGISELPEGLFGFTDMETIDLSSNAITHVPADILEMPVDVAEAISLRNNPLSEESVQRLIAYFQQKGIDFGVKEVIEHAEMEVSDSEGSDVDE